MVYVREISSPILDGSPLRFAELPFVHGKPLISRAAGAVKNKAVFLLFNGYAVRETDNLRLAYQGFRSKDRTFNCELITHFDPGVGQANVIAQELSQVLLNLFVNAMYAVRQRQQQDGPDYQPTITVTTSKTKEAIQIRVNDNGTGIAQSVQQKVFQPFFTTKLTSEGTGLGLSLSYDIVTKSQGGSLQVASQEGKGTEFIINLPV